MSGTIRRGLLAVLATLAWLAAVALVAAWALHHWVAGWGVLPVHVVINDREVLSGIDLGALSIGQLLAIVFGSLLAVLAIAGALGLGLLLGLGLPLLVIGALLAAFALPLLLLALPLWWLLRRLLRGPRARIAP